MARWEKVKVSGKKERVRSLGIDLLGGETGIDGYYDIMIK
jgi:hypothetical protein